MVLLYYALAMLAVSMGYFKGKTKLDRKDSYKNINIFKEHSTRYHFYCVQSEDFLSSFSLSIIEEVVLL